MNRHMKALLILAVPAAIIAGVIFGAKALYGDKSLYTIPGGGNEIDNLTYTRDGTRLLCGRRKSVDIYSLQTRGRTLRMEDAQSMAASAYESRDEKTIWGVWGTSLKSEGKVLDAWDASSGAVRKTVSVAQADSYFFSSDGVLMAVSMRDNTNELGKTVEIWSLTEQKQTTTLTLKEPSRTLAFSPDDTFLAAGEGGTIEILNIQSGASVRTVSVPTPLASASPAVYFTHDGRYLLAAVNSNGESALSSQNVSDISVYVFDAHTYRYIRTIRRYKLLNVSTDGKYVIGMNESGTGDDVIDMVTHQRGLNVVELSTGKVVMRGIQGHKSGIAAAAFSPDMKYIATGGAEGEIKVWRFTPDDGK